jgi:hypothetical protein
LAKIRFIKDDYKLIFLSGIATLSGALSSFILLPHLLVSFAIGISFAYFYRLRNIGFDAWKEVANPKIITTILMPFFLIFPFLIEVGKWFGGASIPATIPEFSIQWLYVLSSIGIVFPLSIIGFVRTSNWGKGYCIVPQGNRILDNISAIVIVGLIGLCFGGYPDVGIKSGLWIRIALVPLASVGLLILLNKINYNSIKVLVISVFVMLFFGTAIINFPTVKYFIQSAWQPVDPGIKNFVRYIRSLPEHSRIALFPSTYATQALVSLTGRQIDFDFSSIRADSYMPPDGRRRARIWWDRFIQNNSKEWSELDDTYDYLISPVGSIANTFLEKRFYVSKVFAGHAVYKIVKRE